MYLLSLARDVAVVAIGGKARCRALLVRRQALALESEAQNATATNLAAAHETACGEWKKYLQFRGTFACVAVELAHDGGLQRGRWGERP
jgi:hypothetical protein